MGVQVNVALPLPPDSRAHYTLVDSTLRQRLLGEFNCYVAHYYHGGRWWARASAQVFTEVGTCIAAPCAVR
jgi:hypothetical protein